MSIFPNPPPTGLTAPSIASAPDRLQPGSSLAQYLILSVAGAGGMGEVYRALDTSLQRDVAIKVLRAELVAAKAERARAHLAREAQTMARLSHPNVVSVHEIGTEAGHVFIVMDYVDGETLRGWLRRAPRGWREVVAMFVQAARGLCAAHRAKVVHRDFKPDNVLVDGEGRARVTDFGVAGMGGADDALDPELTPSAAALVTRATGLVGTPAYMAPEQHRGIADARSDQFAFCVALYEALHGVRPFGGETAAELLESATAGKLAPPAARPAVPLWLRKLVMRGLRPDPDERYPSMEALLAELEHDRAPRRRRLAGAGIAAGVVALAIVTATRRDRSCDGASARMAEIWNRSARDAIGRAFAATGDPEAAATQGRVTASLDGYARRWVGARTDACEATAVRKEQSPELLDLRVDCLENRAEQLAALTRVLSVDVTREALARAPAAADALESPDDCSAARLAGVVPPPHDDAAQARMRALRLHVDEVGAFKQTGQYDRAVALARPVLDEARAVGYSHLEAESLLRLGLVFRDVGDFDTTQEALKDARRAAARSRDDALMARISLDLAMGLIDSQGRISEAAELLSAAEAEVERAGRPPGLRVLLGDARAMFAIRSGRYPDAVAIQDGTVRLCLESLPPEHWCQQQSRIILALALKGTGDYAVAEAVLRHALAEGRAHGEARLEIASRMINLGTVLRLEGRLDEAADLFERARQDVERLGGPEHYDMSRVLAFLAGVRNEQHRYAEGQALAERALAIQERLPRSLFPGPIVIGETLARAILGQGRADDALARVDKLISDPRATSPTARAALHLTRGDALVALARLADARADYARALELEEQATGKMSPSLAPALIGQATCALRLGDPRAALAPLERAILLRTIRPGRPWQLAEARFALAQALRAAGDRGPRPRSLADSARAGLAAAGPPWSSATVEIDAWLAKDAR